MSSESLDSRRLRGRVLAGGTAVLLLVAAVLVILVIAHRLRRQREVTIPQTLTLYGFSALDEVMNQGILPAFERRWLDWTGERLSFIPSYTGSGTITERIIEKFPAEVALLSSEMDAYRLSQRGVIPGPLWRGLPNQGVFARSPMVILVRPGNPLGITDFGDLAHEGVRLLLADPITSGAGEWAILAAYGSAYVDEGGRTQAIERLAGIAKNVIARAPSARALLEAFENGSGDAIVTYEAELLPLARRRVLPGEIVIPKRTIVSEPVAVKIARNIDPAHKERVDAFVEFLFSDEAQQIFKAHGFRGIAEGLETGGGEFPAIEAPFTVGVLGGPRAAQSQILDGIWREQEIPPPSR